MPLPIFPMALSMRSWAQFCACTTRLANLLYKFSGIMEGETIIMALVPIDALNISYYGVVEASADARNVP